MDMRARLLFAFVPLLLVLIALVVTLALFGRTAEARITQQRAATNDLLQGQEFALAVFFEHDLVGHIVVGEEPADSARYSAARAEAQALIAAETGEAVTEFDNDPAIAEAYATLARRHDEAVATAAGGDLAAAQALFERPEVDASLERILELNAAVRQTNRQEFERGDAEGLAAMSGLIGVIIAGLLLGMSVALALALVLIQQMVTPLNRLAVDAEQFAAGERAGQLSAVGNIAQVRRLREAFQQLIDANAARQSGLQAARDELEARISRELQLRETVHALSVPIVPLAKDMLLLPLVGYLDEQRSNELTRSLLDAIQTKRAKSVVLDLTGLAALDDATAERLRQTSEAARLLGCRVTLVGVRADQALTLTAFNLGAAGITVARDIPALLAATKDVSSKI
jgi:anti-anti-sigma regulatory factor